MSGAAAPGTTRVVVALGTAQTLAWASSYYLPAILAAPMAREFGLSPSWVFGAFSAALVLSALLGPAVPYEQVADVIEDVVAAYIELRTRPDELFVDTVRRIGVEPFKERVYAAH